MSKKYYSEILHKSISVLQDRRRSFFPISMQPFSLSRLWTWAAARGLAGSLGTRLGRPIWWESTEVTWMWINC